MEQMQAFIEKARNDKDLMAKLDELGAAGAGDEEFIALAAEYGYIVTAEEYQMAREAAKECKCGKLAEEDLEDVAGGLGFGRYFTENRYDPDACGHFKRVWYNCKGYLELNWCDHYDQILGKGFNSGIERYVCKMGLYDYKA
ncbi:MAG: Nif11-like leader peptide family RiPP precursor [Oscillospiraceae bacterium]|nr:Nif11-like leader peptide family RiPP precursor [Oscillospiraceae bacterium]